MAITFQSVSSENETKNLTEEIYPIKKKTEELTFCQL